MEKKQRPYLFYDTTQSLCEKCLPTVQAHIIFKDNMVFMEKWCPVHGKDRVLISDDVEYYKSCREIYVKKPEMPFYFNTEMEYGCPYDCGLCPDHMQHSCLSVMDIIEECNFKCPVCYADRKKQKHKSLEQIKKMLSVVIKNEKEPDVLQISGGEPTLHPQFFEIMDILKNSPVKHLMINTNGLRIAKDLEFVERLSQYKKGFEVYLQFDSLNDDKTRVLRGADLRKIRLQAIENLNKYNISTTLVMTVKKGLNDEDIGEIIKFGVKQKCVRGVNIQPIQHAGRVENYTYNDHKITISEIRKKIADQTDLFSKDDVIPVPCNPDNLAMAYALKYNNEVIPLTSLIPPEVLIESSSNTVLFEQQLGLKEKIFTTFSTNHSPESQANCLSELMCCLPKVQHLDLTYENVFRVLIVNFMDAKTMDIRALKKSCVHFVTEDKMIPFEVYNIFHRNKQQQEKLQEIKIELKDLYSNRK